MTEDTFKDLCLCGETTKVQFKVIIPRTTQKDSNTTQKSDSTTQKDALKDSNTIQKSDSTTQKDALKDSNTTQKGGFTTQKNVLKDSNTIQKSNFTIQKDLDANQKKVLEYFRNNPKGTRVEVANALGNITEDGVKFIIGKLQQKGLLKRVGGRKHGEWHVLI